MKSVLLISIVFPPEGGGGTIRAAKLAKYLPRSGWRPVVLSTTPPQNLAFASPSMDRLLPVYRAYRFDIAAGIVRLRELVSRLHARMRAGAAAHPSIPTASGAVPHRGLVDKFMIPDPFIGWVPGACLTALRAIAREKVLAVYSTAPTPTTHLVGWFLKRTLGLPWVVEFRDPWTLNPFRAPRATQWLENVERRMEHAVLMAADHIVVTSAEYRDDFVARYPDVPAAKFSFIPNGFDPEDFEGAQAKRFDRWTIVHAGNFYGARSARSFLEGLHRFLCERSAARGQIEVVLVGAENPSTQTDIDDLRLGDVVRQAGCVPHAESIRYMLGADALLLVPGPGRGTMPGKTFEYLAARRPILALADDGTVRSLLEETHAGIAVGAGDREAIAAAIASLFDGRVEPRSATGARERYDRRNIAAAVARVLDHLIAPQQSGERLPAAS
jgi:glycosyltransferase involved in cell wall biosynthesis